MKNVKKLLALLLAMVMLFALCACDKDGDKDSKGDKLTEKELEGEWTATLDMNALSAVISDDTFANLVDLGMDLSKCKLTFVFEDGEATMKADGMVDWYEDYLYAVIDFIEDDDNALAFFALVSDCTVEELEADMANQGATIDDLRAQFDSRNIDAAVEEMADEMEDKTSDYELDDDKLIFDENEWTFTYADGKITITKIENEDGTTKLGKGDFVLKKD